MPTPGAFDIRRLTPSDLPAYKRLRDAMLLASPEAFTSDASEAAGLGPADYRSRLGLDRAGGGVFILGAWQEGLLAGAVSCERDDRLKVRHIVHLTAMMVRREAARRGIGRALLDAALETCRAAIGVEQVTLSVTASNLGAVHLYESAGFVRYARLERALRLDGRYLTKDLMVLVL